MGNNEYVWANTSSLSAYQPQSTGAAAAATFDFISTQLSLNSNLHILCSEAAGSAHDSPPEPDRSESGGDCIYAVDGGIRYHAGDDGSATGSALRLEMCSGPAATRSRPVGVADRCHKRMIKNREAASRSRARKQAYVDQLERQVKILQQENESLRVKYEQLRDSVEVPVPIKKTLQRTLSTPF